MRLFRFAFIIFALLSIGCIVPEGKFQPLQDKMVYDCTGTLQVTFNFASPTPDKVRIEIADWIVIDECDGTAYGSVIRNGNQLVYSRTAMGLLAPKLLTLEITELASDCSGSAIQVFSVTDYPTTTSGNMCRNAEAEFTE